MNHLKKSMRSFLYRKIYHATFWYRHIGRYQILGGDIINGTQNISKILGRRIKYSFKSCIRRILFHVTFLGLLLEIQIKGCKSSSLYKSVGNSWEILKIDWCNYTTLTLLTVTLLHFTYLWPKHWVCTLKLWRSYPLQCTIMFTQE